MAEPGHVYVNVAVNGRFYCRVDLGDYLDYVQGDSSTMNQRIVEKADKIAAGILTQFPNDKVSFVLSRFSPLSGFDIPMNVNGN